MRVNWHAKCNTIPNTGVVPFRSEIKGTAHAAYCIAMSIPVVDFEKVLSCSKGEGLASCGAVQELHSAFTTVGFVFIRNHGIDRRMVGRKSL